jgi:hypothetical protein
MTEKKVYKGKIEVVTVIRNPYPEGFVPVVKLPLEVIKRKFSQAKPQR